MFLNNNQDDLQGLTFRPDEEIEDKPKPQNKKIPAKELLAIILAQYSILIPIALIAGAIFALLLFILTRLMS
ncbi:hypothetical protein [Clostridium amazonitimonense]|uniref:hypothetical protein n=1 Tax=Clostridium amazonitimonense TaxID=1499689 RepID=UPI0005096D05|nr:hypothetical protein [Clostridium amazonitimonense]